MNVLHRIVTTEKGAVTARYRLAGRAGVGDITIETHPTYPDYAAVTFLAPADLDLDVLRPDILPPKP